MHEAITTTEHRRAVGGAVPEVRFPSPTEALGARRLWLWSIPARAITMLSIVSFAAAALGLSSTPRLRALFHLPFPAWWAAAAAAVVASAVAWAGRRRPGRQLPRAWSLVLAALAASVAALAQRSRFRDLPLLHALAAAAVAAAAVLAFRLARPAATSRWAEWVVLAASGFTLLTLICGLPLATRAARGFWEREIAAAVDELALVSRAAAGAAAEQEVSGASLDAVAAARPSRWLQHDRLWSAALALGRDRELAGAAVGALHEAAAALSPERAPSLARLTWPAVWFDRERKAWIEDPRFAPKSRAVSRYYRELSGLLLALRPGAGAAATTAGRPLAPAFDAAWRQWGARLEELAASWSDGWVVAQLPVAQQVVPRGSRSLGELLERPVLRAREPGLRATELWALMGVRGGEAWSMGAQPGCLRHRYVEEAIGILRTDCFAYAARGEDGAELQIELRLVFRHPALEVDFERALPHEVYLLFPIPGGRDAEAHRVEVTSVFSRAVEAAHPHHRFEADRSGTSVNGFRLSGSRQTLRVRSRTIPYVEGRRAVELRAFWE